MGGHRDQFGGHHTGVRVGEQLIDEHCEVELVLGAAGLAVDVELDARASPAGLGIDLQELGRRRQEGVVASTSTPVVCAPISDIMSTTTSVC
jgi:hypothetical protein